MHDTNLPEDDLFPWKPRSLRFPPVSGSGASRFSALGSLRESTSFKTAGWRDTPRFFQNVIVSEP